jgi:chaperonin cofactor prefoldin
MAPMQQLRDEIKDDISSLDDEMKRLVQQQQHAAKQLAATETEVQELFKSNPELTRQLMPAN